MRILFVALNARYIHTNLAVRCLREAMKIEGQKDWSVRIREFSINEQLDNIASEIYEEKPDVIGFSSYIWNINHVLTLIKHLRLVLPESLIFVGGPEVSFDAEKLLASYPQLDAVVIGEGESSVPALIKAWYSPHPPWEVRGVVWRWSKRFRGEYIPANGDQIVTNDSNIALLDLNDLPNPYTEEEDFQGRLVYVETSRGCPYNCKFCISSISLGVRFLDPERFRLILIKLFQYGAQTIKFVDRTFNANKKHAFEILQVFQEEAAKHVALTPRAHCEMAGELLDEEWLQFLRDYPTGMIQLEIGVQSTHQLTLHAISRPQNFSSWQDKVYYLQHTCNIPVHLDLIAGLPHEGWGEFSRSFDDVYEVRPNNLQLGFLKVLKGSEISERSDEYGIVFSADPPYSVLKTRELSHEEILDLKRIEEILEKYYNSGKFRFVLDYLLERWDSPFDFYHSLAEYWKQQSWFNREWSRRDLYRNLWQYLDSPRTLQGIRKDTLLEQQKSIWKEALKFDYYLNERPGQLPEYLSAHNETERSILFDRGQDTAEIIRRDSMWKNVIPEYKLMDRRQWTRATAVERFAFDVPNNPCRSFNNDQDENEVWYLFYYSGKEVLFFRHEGNN